MKRIEKVNFLIRIFTEGGSTGKSLNIEAPEQVFSTALNQDSF